MTKEEKRYKLIMQLQNAKFNLENEFKTTPDHNILALKRALNATMNVLEELIEEV